MSKADRLLKARKLLEQSMLEACSAYPNDGSIIQAKGLIRQAIKKFDEAAKSKSSKVHANQSQFENWWGKIQSGVVATAQMPQSKEGHSKSLNQLDAMIAEEQKKLDELQANANAKDAASQNLLQD